MKFITLHLCPDESLTCNCGKRLNAGKDVYITKYKENSRLTCCVRCAKCLRKDVEEELDRIFGKER